VNEPIRLLLVDDHTLFRDSISERLAREQDLGVVATAGDGSEAVAKAITFRPDIILMDIDMPGTVCFDAAKQITASLPDVRFIFLSAFFHDMYIQQALAVQARGYVTKGVPYATLLEAIRRVASGGVYFSEEVRSRIVVDDDGARLGQPKSSRLSKLTNRELEVLRYTARGLAKKEIAATMHLSYKTIDNHTARLMSKLDIHDRVQLARFAIREGLAEA